MNKLINMFLSILLVAIFFFIYNHFYFFFKEEKDYNIKQLKGDYYSLTSMPSFKNQSLLFYFYNPISKKYTKQFYGRSNGKLKIINNFLYLNEKIITNKYIPNIKSLSFSDNQIDIDLIYDLENKSLKFFKINSSEIKEKDINRSKIYLTTDNKDYIYFLLYLQGNIKFKNNIYIKAIQLKLLFVKKK